MNTQSHSSLWRRHPADAPQLRYPNARWNTAMAPARAKHRSLRLAAALGWLSSFRFPRPAAQAAAAAAGRRVHGRRGGGGLARLPALALAAALGSYTPAARAVDVSCAEDAQTDFYCQISDVVVDRVFSLPELGGNYLGSYLFTGGANSFVEGRTTGTARLTGTIFGSGNTFAVDVLLEGRLDPGDPGHDLAVEGAEFGLFSECLPDGASKWHFYTALKGTLTGTGADLFNGAVYDLTLESGLAQVGIGGNTNNQLPGVFARISYQLADPGTYPNLPPGPFSGKMQFEHLDRKTATDAWDRPVLPQSCFPRPSPDLTGTWEGTSDCAGIADFSYSEIFSDSIQLKIGAQSGWNYPVELSQKVDNGDVVVASYCAQYNDDFGSTETGTGRMTHVAGDPAQAPAMVFVKVGKDQDLATVLKARGLMFLADGPDDDEEPDGLSFCKWSFTKISDAVPAVTNNCPSPLIVNP